MPVTPLTKRCIDCHEDFLARQPHRQDRCPACQKAIESARDRERYQLQKGAVIPITEYPKGDEYVEASNPVWGILAEAIIHDAIAVRRRYGRTATKEVRWLMGKQCQMFCDCVGIDHGIIMAWINRGCPSSPKGEKRAETNRRTRESAHV